MKVKLWRATSDRKWRDRKEDCPGGGVEYVARKAAEDAAREAAIAATGEALSDACETCRYSGDNRRMCESIKCRWLKVKDALARLRALGGKS